MCLRACACVCINYACKTAFCWNICASNLYKFAFVCARIINYLAYIIILIVQVSFTQTNTSNRRTSRVERNAQYNYSLESTYGNLIN